MDFCCILLPKQHIAERFGKGTEKKTECNNFLLSDFVLWATLTGCSVSNEQFPIVLETNLVI